MEQVVARSQHVAARIANVNHIVANTAVQSMMSKSRRTGTIWKRLGNHAFVAVIVMDGPTVASNAIASGYSSCVPSAGGWMVVMMQRIIQCRR